MSGHKAVDIDEYLAALPVRALSAPKIDAPTRYRVWNYPLLKSYNGFDGTERRRGGQLGVWLKDAGCITPPDRCDICGSDGPLSQHAENYYDVSSDPFVCPPCHRAIHLRPWQWDAWRRIVDKAGDTGREWFALAPRFGFDIAQHLRNRWGWSVANIEASPVTPLPETIASRLPRDLLLHPML